MTFDNYPRALIPRHSLSQHQPGRFRSLAQWFQGYLRYVYEPLRVFFGPYTLYMQNSSEAFLSETRYTPNPINPGSSTPGTPNSLKKPLVSRSRTTGTSDEYPPKPSTEPERFRRWLPHPYRCPARPWGAVTLRGALFRDPCSIPGLQTCCLNPFQTQAKSGLAMTLRQT